jgi:ectoine hydroxylase-related dioxygenase (phytanoyl-CoA dioxygenase family)
LYQIDSRGKLNHAGRLVCMNAALRPPVTRALCAIFGTNAYRCTGLAGDFCLPGSDYQKLHADVAPQDPASGLDMRDRVDPPVVVVNYPMQDFTKLNGPMRCLPGTQRSKRAIPALDVESGQSLHSTLVGCPAGSAILRDVRVWHGGTPNQSGAPRVIPNALFAAPDFLGIVGPSQKHGTELVPQMTDEVWRRLSPHGQRICEGIRVRGRVAAAL